MIDEDGVLVQKDQGLDTVKLASEITEYNPDFDVGIDIAATYRFPRSLCEQKESSASRTRQECC